MSRTNVTSRGFISITASSIALIVEAMLIPVVRILPEFASFLAFMSMMFIISITATIGILLGANRYRREKSKSDLMGFLMGELALVLIVLYALVQRFMYA